MTSESCLLKALEEAEQRLETVPEEVKDSIASYSSSLYFSEENSD